MFSTGTRRPYPDPADEPEGELMINPYNPQIRYPEKISKETHEKLMHETFRKMGGFIDLSPPPVKVNYMAMDPEIIIEYAGRKKELLSMGFEKDQVNQVMEKKWTTVEEYLTMLEELQDQKEQDNTDKEFTKELASVMKKDLNVFNWANQFVENKFKFDWAGHTAKSSQDKESQKYTEKIRESTEQEVHILEPQTEPDFQETEAIPVLEEKTIYQKKNRVEDISFEKYVEYSTEVDEHGVTHDIRLQKIRRKDPLKKIREENIPILTEKKGNVDEMLNFNSELGTTLSYRQNYILTSSENKISQENFKASLGLDPKCVGKAVKVSVGDLS
jgi:hypothetical protein